MYLRSVLAFDLRHLRNVERGAVSGAVDDTNIESAVVPTAELWYILACHANHSDPAARVLHIALQDPGANNIILAKQDSIVTGQNLPVDHDFYVPPAWRIAVNISALAVGQSLQLRFAFLRLRLPSATRSLDEAYTIPPPPEGLG